MFNLVVSRYVTIAEKILLPDHLHPNISALAVGEGKFTQVRPFCAILTSTVNSVEGYSKIFIP